MLTKGLLDKIKYLNFFSLSVRLVVDACLLFLNTIIQLILRLIIVLIPFNPIALVITQPNFRAGG